MPFKEDCGFRKINLCTFKEEDCNSEKCDMYNLSFDSKTILDEKKKIKEKIKELKKQVNDRKTIMKALTEEMEQGNTEAVMDYKKSLMLLKDYLEGQKIMNKAFIYCKRSKL